jgi:hypothetical protein
MVTFLLRQAQTPSDTISVNFHDARTVTVTKKSRLGIRHWG